MKKKRARPSKSESEGDGDGASLQCSLCGKSFKTPGGLDYHVKKGVCKGDIEKGKKDDASKTLDCPTCGKTYGSSQALKYHISKKVCIRKHEELLQLQQNDTSAPGNAILSRSLETIKDPKSATEASRYSIFPSFTPLLQDLTQGNLQSTLDNALQERRTVIKVGYAGQQALNLSEFVTDPSASFVQEIDPESGAKTLEPFEAACLSKHEDEIDLVLNVQSKVYSMAFCPAPLENDCALLAVGTSPRMDSINVLGGETPDESDNVLQLWSISATSKTASLACVIKLRKCGTVLDVRWCPAPGAFVEKKRLGLLAVACSSGSVIVLSVPILEAGVSLDASQLAAFEQKVGRGTMALTMDWTLDGKLACGLTDGTVVVWSLAQLDQVVSVDEVCINHRLMPDLEELVASQNSPLELAAEKSVSAVCCSSMDSNLIATLSFNNQLRIWDLRKPTFPIVQTTISLNTNVRATSMAWPHGADYVLIGDEGGRVFVAMLSTADNRALTVHREKVTSLEVNPRVNPPLVASTGSDGLVLAWSVPSMLGSLPSRARVNPKTGRMASRANKPDSFNIKVESSVRLQSGKEEPYAALVLSAQPPQIPHEPAPELSVPQLVLDPQNLLPFRVAQSCAAWGDSFKSTQSPREWLASGGGAALVRVQLFPALVSLTQE